MSDGEPSTDHDFGRTDRRDGNVRKPRGAETGEDEAMVTRRRVLSTTVALGVAGAFGFGVGAAGEHDPTSFVVEQDDTLFCVTALSNGESIESFYDYFGAESHTSTDIEQEDVSLLFVYEGPHGISLVVIHDDGTAGGGGGAATFEFTGLPTGTGQWVVQDDGGDFDSTTDTSPDWSWTAENTDGGAWRGGLNDDFEVTIDPAFNDAAARNPLTPGEITDWQVLSGDASDPDRTSLDLDLPVTLYPGECVDIDIKPGSDPNAIDPDSRGTIPVAILHTDHFDPATVDVSTVRFGDPEDVDSGGGAAPAHGGHLEDVDGDGDVDLVFHFPTRDAGFDGDETQGKLVGYTTEGTPVVGTDSVKLV